ncbi:tape measure protein, partial [Piscirickettsia litoralis]|uniref:tape measure protein n=1 Tax=Piscirickettsia litoralis TaxID=1891921 RepID=UPI0013019808
MSTGSMLADFFAKFSIKIDEKSVEEMNKKTEQAKNALKRMAVATREEAAALTSMHQAAEGLNKSLETLKTFGGMFAIFEMGRSVYDTVVEYQAASNQLENVSGSMSQATSQMKDMYNFSYKLGLSIKTTSEYYGQFLLQMKNMGYSSSKGTVIYKDLLKAFAGHHLTQNFQDMIMRDLLNDMAGLPKLQLGMLKRLEINKMFNVTQLGAKAMGMSVEKFEKEARQGLIKTSQFLPLYVHQMFKEYEKGLTGYQRSLQASYKRLSDSWWHFLNTLGDNGGINLLTSLFKGLDIALQTLSKTIKIDAKLLRQLNDEAPTLTTLAKGLTALYIATKAFNLLKRSPLFLLLTTLQMIAFAIDDIEGHLDGKKSITGSLIKWFGDLSELKKIALELTGVAAFLGAVYLAYKKVSKLSGAFKGWAANKLGKGKAGGLENMATRLVNIEAGVVNVFSKNGKGALGDGASIDRRERKGGTVERRTNPRSSIKEGAPKSKFGNFKSVTNLFKSLS